MAAILPVQDEPVNLTTPFAAGPATSGTFGSAILGPAGTVAAPESARAPGDYLTRFAAKTLSTSRELLYVVPDGTRAVVRHFGLVNTAASQITASLWIGGLLHVPAIPVPVGASRAQDVPEWLMLPGERLEGSASAAGLNLFVYGVEEVREVS